MPTLLLSARCGRVAIRVERKDKSLLSSGPAEDTVVKIVSFHFLPCLIGGIPIVRNAINAGHRAGAVTPAFAVNIHGPVGRVIYEAQEIRSLFRGRRNPGLQRNAEKVHA